MSRVIIFSRSFPAYHPNKGEGTFFVEKLFASFLSLGIEYHFAKLPLQFIATLSSVKFEPKHHTIRAGHRWKVGDKFSPRVWSGKPYASKQIILAPDVEIKKIYPVEVSQHFEKGIGSLTVNINGFYYYENENFIEKLAGNDGLTKADFRDWFGKKKIKGQIISWNDNLNYEYEIL